MPSHYLEKLGLTVNAIMLSRGLVSPLVLYLRSSNLYEWEWADGEAFAIQVLLPELWTSTVAKPNV